MNPPADSLQGKVAFITGAGSGLGEAVARMFAACGARIGAVDRDEEKLKKICDEITAGGGTIIALPADVSVPEQMQAAVDKLDQTWGRLDIVVANAGINGTWAPVDLLTPEDWEKQTLAPAWVVKDVVAHLLDGNIRSLSSSQDGYFPKDGNAIDSYSDLVKYLNQLNADWVTAMKRVSPQVLITLLDMTNKLYNDHLSQLDPFAKSIFPVAWAGESESQNWFHIAREYTEKWHHQQQIRETLGTVSPLFEKRFFRPFLDTSLRHITHHFRNLKGELGDTFSVIISGNDGLNSRLAAL